VISEFSHNGKLHIWPAEWRNSPQLGREAYVRDDLSGKGLPFPSDPYSSDGGGLRHDGSNVGKWQGSAADLIERRAGIRIKPQEWQLK
jgi:hypothetical protein